MKVSNLLPVVPVISSVLGSPIGLEKRGVSGGNVISLLPGDYPRVTKLSDGSYLGAGHLTVFTSENANFWTSIGDVTADGLNKDIGNTFPYQSPDGTYWAAYRNHDKQGSGYSTYRITLSKYDNGWQYLSEPIVVGNVNGGTGLGVWEPFLRTASDGKTTQLYYSRELAGDHQQNVLRTTTDGINWSDEIVVSNGIGFNGENRRDGMTGVAQYDDNPDHLIAVFESLNGNSDEYIGSVTSTDGGNTWNQDTRATVHSPAANFRIGAPQVIKVGEKLVVSFQSSPSAGAGTPNSARFIYGSTGTSNQWSGLNNAGTGQWNGLTDIDDSTFLYEVGDGEVKKYSLS